jgi:tetratricopeptide (TPR) repeat protein
VASRPALTPEAPPPAVVEPVPTAVAAAGPARRSNLFGLGVAALAVLVLGASFFVMTRGPAGSTPDATTATEAAPPSIVSDVLPPTPGATATPATPVAPPDPPPVTNTVATPPPASATPPKTPARNPAPATAKPATGTPAAAPPAAAAKEIEARERLEVARAKLGSNLVDQGVNDLRQILLDYPGSPVAVEAAFLAAESLEKAGRPDDAMAVYVEFDRRFAGNARVAESKLRRARLLQAAKAQPRQVEGYQLLGEVARDFPATPEARAALQAKRQIEAQRKQLKGVDPVLRIEVPALLVTLRMIADQFPGEAQTMVALNQLASGYDDMDQYQAAADVWEHMAAQFPGNPAEVWFRLGELYERRLRNPDKARAAYEKVPADSPRYKDAQQRLKRR